jgi:hypothetical protein
MLPTSVRVVTKVDSDRILVEEEARKSIIRISVQRPELLTLSGNFVSAAHVSSFPTYQSVTGVCAPAVVLRRSPAAWPRLNPLVEHLQASAARFREGRVCLKAGLDGALLNASFERPVRTSRSFVLRLGRMSTTL